MCSERLGWCCHTAGTPGADVSHVSPSTAIFSMFGELGRENRKKKGAKTAALVSLGRMRKEKEQPRSQLEPTHGTLSHC